MTIYIYDTTTGEAVDTVEANRYDGTSVSGPFGTIGVGGPLEFSSLPDLSQTLRADWRARNPSPEVRPAEVEALLAEMIFGGDVL